MILKKERERMSYIILKDIVERIQEYGVKAEKGNLNDAYFLAWQIGIQSDIEDSLKKCKASNIIKKVKDEK
ncbi:hypothetical protein LCGC14_0441850 [marine sediment metagenome]|uniref:Uncharacterized protein n=1 Tax=marine sediment metagenome TaxID=412755 RepID=A0A0F9V745_9ZZZZ